MASPTADRSRAPALLVGASLAIGVVFAGPLLYLVVEVLRDVGGFTDALGGNLAGPLGRTLALAVGVSASATVAGTYLAWLVARTDVPFRAVFRVLAPLPLVVPSFVGAAALIAAVAPGGMLSELFGLDSLPEVKGFGGAWLVLTLFTYPYVYLPVVARFGSLPPSLEESARLLGRGPIAVFRTVVLPQTAPAMWAGALLVFLYTVSDFGAVQLLRYDTLTRAIYSSRLTDPALSRSLSLVLAALAVTVVVGERGWSRRRARIELGRAKHALPVPLGRWRWPAAAGAGLLVGNALVGPLAVLAWWAVRGMTNEGVGRLVVDVDELSTAVRNTAVAGVTAALAAVMVVLPVAYLTGRFRSASGGAASTMVVAGFALPGLVVALALTSWVLDAGAVDVLYQTFPMLILAYVVHFGAQAMRAAQVAVAAVPGRLEDAARTLGAGRWRRLRTVEAPLMAPGLAAGAGLVLLSTMKELPATLLLAPIGFRTLATRTWAAAEEGFLAEAGLSSLVLVALSGVLTWVLVIRRAERFD